MSFKNQSGIGFVLFADGRRSVKFASYRLMHQINSSKVSSKTSIYNLNLLQDRLSRKDKNFLEKNKNVRGFGYWIWKPFTILDFIKNNPTLKYVVYLDAGVEFHFTEMSSKRFKEYIDVTEIEGLCAFSTQNDKAYTKRKTLAIFNLAESEIEKPQIQSGILIFKREVAETICTEWINLMRSKNYQNLVDKNDTLIEDDSFIEHRHDQSLLSLLIKSKKIGHIYPADQHTWPSQENNFLASSPFWAVRNMYFTPKVYQHFWNPLYVLERGIPIILRKAKLFYKN
jgi:hypothetical protein